jgi:hypothetical protein
MAAIQYMATMMYCRIGPEEPRAIVSSERSSTSGVEKERMKIHNNMLVDLIILSVILHSTWFC